MMTHADTMGPCEWAPNVDLSNVQWRREFTPKLHILDPMLVLSMMLIDSNLVGPNGEEFRAVCQNEQLTVKHDECLDYLFSNTWGLDAEKDSIEETDALNSFSAHFISSADTASFLVEPSKQALEDGLDGIVAIVLSFDKTMVTAKRTAYPLLMRIANIRGRSAMQSNAFELIGMLSSELHPQLAQYLTKEQQRSIQQALTVRALNLVFARIEQFSRLGALFQIGTNSSNRLQLRPVFVFSTVDTPDAHVFCNTVQSWHPSCLAHSRSAAVDQQTVAATCLFEEEDCTVRLPHHYSQTYKKAMNSSAGSFRNSRKLFGIHPSQRAARITSKLVGMEASCPPMLLSPGTRIGADIMHQVLDGALKGLFENVILSVVRCHAMSKEEGPAESDEVISITDDFTSMLGIFQPDEENASEPERRFKESDGAHCDSTACRYIAVAFQICHINNNVHHTEAAHRE